MASKRAMVTVCRQGVAAYEEPRVLFEAGGKLYLSAAVFEYDPKQPRLTDTQRDTIARLQKQLESGRKVHAVLVDLAALGGGIITANMVGPGPIGGDDPGNR